MTCLTPFTRHEPLPKGCFQRALPQWKIGNSDPWWRWKLLWNHSTQWSVSWLVPGQFQNSNRGLCKVIISLWPYRRTSDWNWIFKNHLWCSMYVIITYSSSIVLINNPCLAQQMVLRSSCCSNHGLYGYPEIGPSLDVDIFIWTSQTCPQGCGHPEGGRFWDKI